MIRRCCPNNLLDHAYWNRKTSSKHHVIVQVFKEVSNSRRRAYVSNLPSYSWRDECYGLLVPEPNVEAKVMRHAGRLRNEGADRFGWEAAVRVNRGGAHK